MSMMDNTDFYFISNSNVLKNHLIFHYAFKNFYKKYKNGRFNIYIFDTRIKSNLMKTTSITFCSFIITKNMTN